MHGLAINLANNTPTPPHPWSCRQSTTTLQSGQRSIQGSTTTHEPKSTFISTLTTALPNTSSHSCIRTLRPSFPSPDRLRGNGIAFLLCCIPCPFQEHRTRIPGTNRFPHEGDGNNVLTYDNPCLNCGMTNDQKSGLLTCRICIGCRGGGQGEIGGGGGGAPQDQQMER